MADLSPEVMAERERCMRIVSAARSGDISQDFRAILHFIEDGDHMHLVDGEYVTDSEMRDRMLAASFEGGAPSEPFVA